VSQVKHTLCLRQNEKQIIIGTHARRRIAERLGWSKKIYKQLQKFVSIFGIKLLTVIQKIFILSIKVQNGFLKQKVQIKLYC